MHEKNIYYGVKLNVTPYRETGSLGSGYVRVGISYLELCDSIYSVHKAHYMSLVGIVKGTGQF